MRFPALIALASAAALTAAADERLDVVATLPTLGSVAREVGGDRVEVAVLARPGEDPHFVDGKPSFLVKLRDADLFVVNGCELEIGWVPPLLEGARNGAIQPGRDGYFDASSAVTLIEKPTGPVDRSQGDVHVLGNPHFTCDPLALRAVAGALADRLAKIDAAHADIYAANRKAYERRIDEALFGADLVEEAGGGKLARLLEAGELDAWLAENALADRLGGWLKAMAAAKGKEVVAFHKNMNYFWKRFGVVLADTVEPKPGIPPSSKHVAEVVLAMREKKIAAVVTQPFYGRSAVDLIAEKTGARVVSVDLEGDDALAMIDRIVREVGAALR